MKKPTLLISLASLSLLLLLQACLGFSKSEESDEENPSAPSTNLTTVATPPILSLLFYDYNTDSPITKEILLTPHPESPNKLLAANLEDFPNATIKAGHFNFALEKGKGEGQDGQQSVVFQVESSAYFSRSFHLNLPDSGVHTHKLYLVPKKDAPASHSITTHKVADLDPAINPLSAQLPNQEAETLSRTVPNNTGAASWDTATFIFEPNRPSNHWFPGKTGVIIQSRLTTSTWSKIPELMEPFYISSSDQTAKVSLFSLSKTEVSYLEDTQFYKTYTAYDTSYTPYGNRPAGKMIFSFLVTPGDFNDATDWYSNFMKLSKSNQLKSHTIDLAQVLPTIRLDGGVIGDGGYYRDVDVQMYSPPTIPNYLETIYKKETMANLFINDSLSGLYAKNVIVNFQWQLDSTLVTGGSVNPNLLTNGGFILPLGTLHYYTDLNYKSIQINFSSTPPSNSTLQVVGGGQHSRSFISSKNAITLSLPVSPSNFTISTPSGSIEHYVDLTNDEETITLDLPSTNADAENVDLKLNLTCPNKAQNFKLDNLYNTSIHYRKAGSTAFWQVGSIQGFLKNYAQKITAAIVQLQSVQTGSKYDIKVVGGGESITQTISLEKNKDDGTYANSTDFLLNGLLCN